MYLPDNNLWLALAFPSHAHHASAKAWMQTVTDKNDCCFCRVTQMGFLRLATNPKVLGSHAVPMFEAWRGFDLMLSDDRIAVVEEPSAIDAAWRGFTQRQSFSTNVWTDAYLAAFAMAADMKLVTFDKGFTQFKGLRVTILY